MSNISLNPILTEAGLEALRNSQETGLEAKIGYVAIGDIGCKPISMMTSLQNELVRVPCYSGGITGKNQVTVTANIPPESPEFFVRELGFFLEDGTLFAYWSNPDQALGYRSLLLPWFFKFVLSWNVSGSVTVTFDQTNTVACLMQDLSSLESKVAKVINDNEEAVDIDDETQLARAILNIIQKNAVMSEEIRRMKEITQQDYEALTIKDPNALYVILGA